MKIIKYSIVIVLLTVSFATIAYAEIPELPEVSQSHYVIYKEGNRNNRIEVSFFDISDKSEQSIVFERPYKLTLFGDIISDTKELAPKPQTQMTLTNNSKYCNDSKYYLDGDKWVHFEDGYNKISENATELISADLPYVEAYYKSVNDSISEHLSFETVVFDGKNYIGTTNFQNLYISNDKIHFNSVFNNNSELRMANELYPPLFVSGNDIILGYVVIPDAEYANKALQEYILEPLQIYDSNYNFVGKNRINFFIDNIIFYNGYFYIKKSNGDYVKTTNGYNFLDSNYDEYIRALSSKTKNTFGSYYFDDSNNLYKMINKNNGQSYPIISEYSNFERTLFDGEKIVSKLYLYGDKLESQSYVSLDGIYGIPIPCDALDNFWYYDNCTYMLGANKIYKATVEQFKENTIIVLDNNILRFKNSPIIESDRTLVPMRFLFEQMGADVNWNDATQTATATIDSARGGGEMLANSAVKGFVDSAAAVGLAEQGTAFKSKAKPLAANTASDTNSVTFSIDNTTATVNGEAATMDVPARLINDQTFVPLRFLSENLGYDVEWDESTNTAIITTN